MAPNPNLKRLHDAGVSIWLDTLSRQLLDSGEFAVAGPRLQRHRRDVEPHDLRQGDHRLRAAMTTRCRSLSSQGARDPQELFFALALDDVRKAARAAALDIRRERGA